MKNTKNTTIKKLLLSLILVIMLGNFVMPTRVQADIGGELAKPIMEFVTWIADEVLGFLQRTLINGGSIKNSDNEYAIYYSPGNIFANKIAIFDVNFVEPNKYKTIYEDNWKQIHNVTNADILFGLNAIGEWTIKRVTIENKFGLDLSSTPTKQTWYSKVTGEVYDVLPGEIIGKDIQQITIYEWPYNGKQYKFTEEEDLTVFGGYNGRLYEKVEKPEENLESIANTLQPNIAKWYKAMRTLSLVGLLSVLVYIGIRIIISSSSEDKAKYKKMLANWIAAVCIVFVLHYIMVFILNISQQIINIFGMNTPTDTYITDLRKNMGYNIGANFTNVVGETVCYVVLVIYTCIFTIQYLKRVVYMAFLTMIAPLIALTYPLDKIKDGKAQAFSMWLKEYIFNALLQPIHLLLYIILVGRCGD